MTTVQSSGTGIASRTAEPRQLRRMKERTGILPPDEDCTGMLRNATSPDGLHELVLLEEFLTRHIRQDGLRSVQCMLLWTEWVRTCARQTRRFPRIVLEAAFRQAVSERIGCDIAHDDDRGAVWPGIRFVP